MDDKELFQLRQKWYAPNSPAMFEMVKCMYGREVILLEAKTQIPLFEKRASPVRMIKAHSVKYLQMNFEAFDFYNKNYSIYQSCAFFEGMPMASFSPVQRKLDQQSFFQGVGFDLCWKKHEFFIDIDAQKREGAGEIKEVNSIDANEKVKEYYFIDEMYSDAKKLKAVLDEFGMAYSIAYSGLKGFHFVIRDENIFPQNMKLKDKVILAETIAKNIKAIENIPTIDDTIYQATRIRKVNYSLDGFNVVLPLSNQDFESWSPEKMRIDNVLKNVVVRNRGLLERQKTKDSADFVKLFGGI